MPCHVTTLGPHAPYTRSPSPHARETARAGYGTICNTPSTPGPAIFTPDSPLGSYTIITDQHESFVRTLSSLVRTRQNFLVGHPSQDFSRPSTLNPEVLSRQASKKEDAPSWYDYPINSIKPWARISPSIRARISQSTHFRRPTSSSVNPKPGTSPLGHICMSSVIICHVM
jgi:hypothetical protein